MRGIGRGERARWRKRPFDEEEDGHNPTNGRPRKAPTRFEDEVHPPSRVVRKEVQRKQAKARGENGGGAAAKAAAASAGGKEGVGTGVGSARANRAPLGRGRSIGGGGGGGKRSRKAADLVQELPPGAVEPAPEVQPSSDEAFLLTRAYNRLVGRDFAIVADDDASEELRSMRGAYFEGSIVNVCAAPLPGRRASMHKEALVPGRPVAIHYKRSTHVHVETLTLEWEQCASAFAEGLAPDIFLDGGLRFLVADDVVAVRAPPRDAPDPAAGARKENGVAEGAQGAAESTAAAAGGEDGAAGGDGGPLGSSPEWRLAVLFVQPGAMGWEQRTGHARARYLDGAREWSWLDLQTGRSGQGALRAPVVAHALELWRSVHWLQLDAGLKHVLQQGVLGALEEWQRSGVTRAWAAAGLALVGTWVSVYWDGNDEWFDAKVVAYDPASKAHRLLYAIDGESEAMHLDSFKWVWVHDSGPPAFLRRTADAAKAEPTVLLPAAVLAPRASVRGCLLCSVHRPGDVEGADLLRCTCCGGEYHRDCLERTLQVALGEEHLANWRCVLCKVCETCGARDGPTRLAVCEICDRAHHIGCLTPPLKTFPTRGFRCPECVVCLSCGTRTPGPSSESRWTHGHTLCAPCGSLFSKGARGGARSDGGEEWQSLACELSERDLAGASFRAYAPFRARVTHARHVRRTIAERAAPLLRRRRPGCVSAGRRPFPIARCPLPNFRRLAPHSRLTTPRLSRRQTCALGSASLWLAGKYCPICHKVYREQEADMVGCDACNAWVHARCDNIDEEELRALGEDADRQYRCPNCRGERRTQVQQTTLERLCREDRDRFFAEPVVSHEAPSYHTIIERPMDFGTMRRKALAGEYVDDQAFRDDFALLVENAQVFNRPDTRIGRAAKRLERVGHSILDQLMPHTVRRPAAAAIADDVAMAGSPGAAPAALEPSASGPGVGGLGASGVAGGRSTGRANRALVLATERAARESSAHTSLSLPSAAELVISEADSIGLVCVDLCVACGSGSGGLPTPLLICMCCGEAYHSFCAPRLRGWSTPAVNEETRRGWTCGLCKPCERCGHRVWRDDEACGDAAGAGAGGLGDGAPTGAACTRDTTANGTREGGNVAAAPSTVVCGLCDRGFHLGCLPESMRPPAGIPFRCPTCYAYCDACKGSVKRDATPQSAGAWCADCAVQGERGQSCPVCLGVFDADAAEEQMVLCSTCGGWVHVTCDNIDADAYAALASDEIWYQCPICRSDKSADIIVWQRALDRVVTKVLATRAIAKSPGYFGHLLCQSAPALARGRKPSLLPPPMCRPHCALQPRPKALPPPRPVPPLETKPQAPPCPPPQPYPHPPPPPEPEPQLTPQSQPQLPLQPQPQLPPQHKPQSPPQPPSHLSHKPQPHLPPHPQQQIPPQPQSQIPPQPQSQLPPQPQSQLPHQPQPQLPPRPQQQIPPQPQSQVPPQPQSHLSHQPQPQLPLQPQPQLPPQHKPQLPPQPQSHLPPGPGPLPLPRQPAPQEGPAPPSRVPPGDAASGGSSSGSEREEPEGVEVPMSAVHLGDAELPPVAPEPDDPRRCALCADAGEPPSLGRLLYVDTETFAHAQCVLWASEVYEKSDGSLVNAIAAVRRNRRTQCAHCGAPGASVGCDVRRCPKVFHIACAPKAGCTLRPQALQLLCADHKSEEDRERERAAKAAQRREAQARAEALARERRAVLERALAGLGERERAKELRRAEAENAKCSGDPSPVEMRALDEDARLRGGPAGCLARPLFCVRASANRVALEPDDLGPGCGTRLRVGALIVDCIGDIEPLRANSHDAQAIFPTHFKSRRRHWSVLDPRRRVTYTCEVEPNGADPSARIVFQITCMESNGIASFVTQGKSPGEAWIALQKSLMRARAVTNLVQAPSQHALSPPLAEPRGAIFFGFGVPAVRRIIQSMPGAGECSEYRPLRAGPEAGDAPVSLPVSLSGCARTDGFMRYSSTFKCKYKTYLRPYANRGAEPSMLQLVLDRREANAGDREGDCGGDGENVGIGARRDRARHKRVEPERAGKVEHQLPLGVQLKAMRQRIDSSAVRVVGGGAGLTLHDTSLASVAHVPMPTLATTTDTQVLRSPIHKWGLFTTLALPKDTMLVEYVGQALRNLVSDRRERMYEASDIGRAQGGDCYMFRLDDETVVDATTRGNIARFINHSCDPNSYCKVVMIDQVKRIIIFAKRNIGADEEITYDYKFATEKNKIECHCGSARCVGRMN